MLKPGDFDPDFGPGYIIYRVLSAYTDSKFGYYRCVIVHSTVKHPVFVQERVGTMGYPDIVILDKHGYPITKKMFKLLYKD